MTKQINTKQDMKKYFSLSKPESDFKPGKILRVTNKMQSNYEYQLTEPIGKNFHPDFNPALSPKQMLELGVFEGKYCNDCILEYPKEWFEKAFNKNKLSPEGPNKSLNRYKVKSRQSLRIWQEKGWIYGDDPRGWFEWFMRYYLGRRDSQVDKIQIRRWKHNIAHLGALKKQCPVDQLYDNQCGIVRKQLLIQWSYPLDGHK